MQASPAIWELLARLPTAASGSPEVQVASVLGVLSLEGSCAAKLQTVWPTGPTLSLLSAIMAPSLNTASSTIRMVGKYLQGGKGMNVKGLQP